MSLIFFVDRELSSDSTMTSAEDLFTCPSDVQEVVMYYPLLTNQIETDRAFPALWETLPFAEILASDWHHYKRL